MMHELVSDRLIFMLKHGFKRIEQFDDYVIADNKYYYPICWILNDYIFYKKICRLEE
jgi:hypothetical protein